MSATGMVNCRFLFRIEISETSEAPSGARSSESGTKRTVRPLVGASSPVVPWIGFVMGSFVRHAFTQFGVWTSHPSAFAIVGAYVGIWLVFSANTFDWHAIATIATWLMTLFIQRAEHRDTQAIHAKLDELLRAEGRARNELTTVDDQEPEEIERHRQEERRRLDLA